MHKSTKLGLVMGAVLATSLLAVGCSGKSAGAKTTDSNAFEVATVRWADWGEAYHTGFPDAAAKEAGIDLKWRTILNSDWADKKAVTLAGGDLPDAFLCLKFVSAKQKFFQTKDSLFHLNHILMNICQTSKKSSKRTVQ